jgi:hypothetical protein
MPHATFNPIFLSSYSPQLAPQGLAPIFRTVVAALSRFPIRPQHPQHLHARWVTRM